MERKPLVHGRASVSTNPKIELQGLMSAQILPTNADRKPNPTHQITQTATGAMFLKVADCRTGRRQPIMSAPGQPAAASRPRPDRGPSRAGSYRRVRLWARRCAARTARGLRMRRRRPRLRPQENSQAAAASRNAGPAHGRAPRRPSTASAIKAAAKVAARFMRGYRGCTSR